MKYEVIDSHTETVVYMSHDASVASERANQLMAQYKADRFFVRLSLVGTKVQIIRRDRTLDPRFCTIASEYRNHEGRPILYVLTRDQDQKNLGSFEANEFSVIAQ